MLVKLSGASLPASLSSIKLRIEVAGQKFVQDFAPAPNLGYRFLWDGRDNLGRLVSGRQPALVQIGYEYPLIYTAPPDGNWHTLVSFGSLSDSVTLSGAPGRTDMTSWQDLPSSDTTVGTYLAKGARLGAWTIDANHVYDFGGVLWRGDGEREKPVTSAASETVLFPACTTETIRIAPAADGTIYVTGRVGDAWLSGDPRQPDIGQIWKFNPALGTHTLLSTSGVPTAEAPGCGWSGRQIVAIASAPDESVYFSASLCSGNAGALYIDHLKPDGTFLGSWLVEEANPTYPAGAVLAIAVGPDGTPYYLDQRGSCLRLMKLEADGRKSQVAGGDCTNLVASGDGGPPKAATFKAISALPSTPPADLAVGQDGSIYVTNQSECRVRRIWPSGIIDTVAGSTCPSAGSHTGDGGPATAARITPTSIAIDRDDTLFIGDYDYWEVQCGSGGYAIPGCWGYGTGSWMEPRSRIRTVRSGVINSIAGAQATYAPPHSPAMQRPIGIPVDLAIGADWNIYYVESKYGNMGLTSNPPDNYPHAIRRLGVNMPGVPRTAAAIQLASQDGQEVYNFNMSGQHESTQDALTGAIRYQFGYDAAGTLTSVTDANGLITSVERDPDTGLATAIVAPNGQRTELTMSDDGYLAAIDEPGGAHREFSYDSSGLLQMYKKPNQATTSFIYDDMGRLVHEDMPGGGSWTLTRTGPTLDNVNAPVHVSAVSAEGKAWTCNRATDSNGNVTRTNSGPSGLQSTLANTQAALNTGATPDGMNWSVTQAADPRFGMQAPVPATTVVTTPGGKTMTTTVARAATMSGPNLVSQVDTTTVNGKASTSTYNVAAKTIINASPLGRQTVSTLDAQGRVVQVQAGNLAPTAYTYDSRGRLATVTVGSGTSARVTTFGYDSLDRLASVTDPLSRVQSYVYDDANRVVGQVFTDGSEVGFSYDSNGNVTSVTPPSRPEHDFGYTPADLMSSYTPPVVSGTGATTYEYNRDKQPTFIHRPDGSQIAFVYDTAGRLSTTTYPSVGGNVTVTRTYDPVTGKLKTVSTSDGQSLAYTYDGKLPLSATWSGTVAGSVSRTYDNNFRVASESVNGANSVALGYDNDSLLTSAGALTLVRDPTNGTVSTATFGTLTFTYQYTTYGELKDVTVTQASTPLFEENIPDNGVGRDSLGRIQQKTETIQGVSHTYNYSYDTAGRLLQVSQDGNLTATYTYDANGNRISGSGLTTTPVYDAQDRLLNYGKWTYVYTANGELQSKTDTTSGQATSYSYDGMGNLRHVSLPDGRAIDYVIDSLNRRIAKKLNGSVVRKWVFSDGLTPAAEFDGNGNLVSRFEGTDYLVQGSTTYRIVKDHLGSPRLIVNATSGAVAQRLDYDEWGKVTVSGAQPAGWQPLGFAGGVYDADTGLVRFGARDYDAATGRWIVKDPIGFGGGQANVYVYAGDDPVNATDIIGLCGFWDRFKKAFIERRSETEDVLSFPTRAIISGLAGMAYYPATGTISPLTAVKSVVSPPSLVNSHVPTLFGTAPAEAPLAAEPGIAAFAGTSGTLAAGAFGAITKGLLVSGSLEAGIAIGSAAGALGEALSGDDSSDCPCGQ